MEHKRSQVALLAGNAASLLIAVGINGVANEDVLPGVFLSNVGDISDKYYLNITPASWTFSIWAFIYIAQFLFVSYSLSLICRKGPENYLYRSPEGMIPNIVYLCYITANLGNIAWIFLWDRELFTASGTIIAVLAFSLLVATGYSIWGLHKVTPELQKAGLEREIWLNRILVQNSLAMYATWVCIATLLNFGIVLCYVLGVPQELAGTVSLGVLSADLVIWFIVDIFVIFRASNYLVIPYVVVIVALIGSINKNFVGMATNSMFTVILLIVALGAFLVKVVTMLWRHWHMDDKDDKGSQMTSIAN